MRFNYQIILFLICLFLIYQYIHKLRSKGSLEYKNNNKEIQKNNKVDVDIPLTTTITQQLSENKSSKNENEIITPNPEYLKHDIISPNPENTTELRFVDEDNKGAWSSINVSQHPKYYTSNFTNELTNVGAFFKNNQFNDNTSAYSKDNLPDRCSFNGNNEIICNFNNKLQNIPPQLINDDNQLINQLGNENIYKGTTNSNISSILGNEYQTWDYENEKLMNGGKYFENVYGSSKLGSNEGYLKLNDLPINYSI